MNIVNVKVTKGNPESFYSDNCVAKRNYTSGKHNKSVDGTGVDVSISASIGSHVAQYINKKFTTEDGFLKVVDLGTGKGHLVDQMKRYGIDSFGIEGSAYCARQAICDKKSLVVCDLSAPIKDERLNKAFHLSTSFELFEHIHRRHEDAFLNNLAYLSDYHLCSINVDEWPGIKSNHCNIKHPCCWAELFRKHNIKYKILGGATKAGPHVDWTQESVIPIQYNKIADNEEFRDGVRHSGWDEWPFSIFCLLDFVDYDN